MGFFTLLAARAVGLEGRVFAFEPFQQNVKLLFLSTRHNGFENITILPVAAADREALFFYDNMGSNGQIRETSADLELLVKEHEYEIDVLHEDGSATRCQRDTSRILDLYEAAGSDHIDIVARPGAI